jgi:hypothetical protein
MTWKPWENLGGTLIHGVAASCRKGQIIDVFAIEADRTLQYRSWEGGYCDIDNLGGECYSAPASVSWDSDNISVFVKGSDDSLKQKSWDGDWNLWKSHFPDEKFAYSVAVASKAPNTMDRFAVGTENQFRYDKWENNSWSYQAGFGNFGRSAPAAIWRDDTCLDIFMIGSENILYHTHHTDEDGWHAWEDLGEVGPEGVAVSSREKGKMDIFALAPGAHLQHKSWDGAKWSDRWENLGGLCCSAPASVSVYSDRIDVFVIGQSKSLEHLVWSARN